MTQCSGVVGCSPPLLCCSVHHWRVGTHPLFPLTYLCVCIWRGGGGGERGEEGEREEEGRKEGGRRGRERGGGEKGGKGERVKETARKKRRNEGRRGEGKRKEVGNYGQDTQCATKLPIFAVLLSIYLYLNFVDKLYLIIAHLNEVPP